MNAINNQSLQLSINSMLMYYQNGQYEMAENLALSIKNKIPNNNITWKVLAGIYGNINKMEKALTAIKEALKIDSKDAEAHSNMGLILFKLNLLEKSIRSYKKAIELKIDYAEAYNNLAIILHKLGKLQQAEFNYKKAIALKPNFDVAYNNLGNTFKDLNKLNEAETSYKKAIELRPNYAEAKKNLDILLRENKLLQLLKTEKLKTKNNISDLESDIRLSSNPFITNRVVETELLSDLYKVNSTELSKTKGGPLFGVGRTTDYQLFENNFSIFKTLKKDLIYIMKQAVKSEVYIMESFLNILRTGGGSIPHIHIVRFDKNNNLIRKKYSLVYYISVGDQNCSEPGIFKVNDPDEDILPTNGMIMIIPADRKHSAVYNGKIDRIMIGINFYSLI